MITWKARWNRTLNRRPRQDRPTSLMVRRHPTTLRRTTTFDARLQRRTYRLLRRGICETMGMVNLKLLKDWVHRGIKYVYTFTLLTNNNVILRRETGQIFKTVKFLLGYGGHFKFKDGLQMVSRHTEEADIPTHLHHPLTMWLFSPLLLSQPQPWW